MKRRSLCTLTLLLLGFSAVGQTNEWTKSTSGNWEESYWSLGRLPGIDQQFVAIDNYGWKAVAIGPNTTANYPQSLSLNNLLIDGPTNSMNTLLLNWAYLDVPLLIHSNLTIGAKGSLVSHYSALQAAVAGIQGSASFLDYATEDFGELSLISGGTLGLTNGMMTCSNLYFADGTFTQSGGIHSAQGIHIPYQSGSYFLQGGTLISQELQIGDPWGFVPGTAGIVWQTGGVHTNGSIDLRRYDGNGSYRLDGGILVSSNVSLTGSNSFIQNGGTNHIRELTGGDFTLNGGQLVTTNTTVYLFRQTGGTHIVGNQLQFAYGGSYELAGGNLLAADIEMAQNVFEVSSNANLVTANFNLGGSELIMSSQGTVSNLGILTCGSEYYPALITIDNAAKPQYLGQLLLAQSSTIDAHDPIHEPTNATVLRFADSHTLPWTGLLVITNWGLNSGDHIYFGTNDQALTVAQLDQIRFGLNSAPAKLLSTGELVPISATNEWIKPTSGSWEEPYWSLGRLPGMDQGFVVFDNPGWKALAIGPNTTAHYADSLSLYNLLIDGPTNSVNTLLLNWAGLNVPLSVYWNLTIGANGSLDSHYSALHAENAYIDGTASFSDYSTENFGQLTLRSGGTVGLTNGIMTSSNLMFYTGTFTQIGGTHSVNIINNMADGYNEWYRHGEYDLQGGTLISTNVGLGSGGGFYPEGHASIHQTGGVHTNTGMFLAGWSHHWATTSLGAYILDGGLFTSSSVGIGCGYFSQTGGTNRIQELYMNSGGFALSGGVLVTSNVSVSIGSEINSLGFYQTGGVHTVQGQLLINGPFDNHYNHEVTYELSGGLLVTSNILVQSGAFLVSSQGTVSNAGIVTLTGGYLLSRSNSATQYFGQLQLSASPTNYPWDVQRTGGSLDLNYYPGQSIPAVWRFADSHTLPWTGILQVWDWGAGSHIFFGTNAQGLTAAQVDQVRFMVNGPTPTSFPAVLLPTGELVPAAPPPLGFTNSGNALVLSWPGGYELVSSTNVNGTYLPIPGATSPFTNSFVDPQRFFRLRLPLP